VDKRSVRQVHELALREWEVMDLEARQKYVEMAVEDAQRVRREKQLPQVRTVRCKQSCGTGFFSPWRSRNRNPSGSGSQVKKQKIRNRAKMLLLTLKRHDFEQIFVINC
jgi:hypothetical protein